MEDNQQYIKYKSRLKTLCIISAITSVVSLLAGILLVFLPIFTINLATVEANVSFLPKLNNLSVDVLLSENPSVDFSVYDEVYAAIMLMTGANDVEGLAAFSTSGILQLFGIIFIAVGIVASIVSLVKNILNILSPDNYALDMYDKIKRRVEEPKRKRNYYGSSSYWIIVGIIYEIFAIIISTFMGRALGDRYITSYFSLMSGVNGLCVILIIVLIAAVALFICSKLIKNNIRLAILREDYNVEKNQTPQ